MSKLLNCLIKKDISCVPVWFMRQAGRYLPEFRKLRSLNPNFLKLCFNSNLASEITLQPMKRFDLDADEVLNNIMVGRAFTVDSLFTLLMKAAGAMVEDSYALLVVDSIMAPFRVDFSGRGELSERQQVLGRFLNKVQKITEQFNVACFMTN